MRAADPPSEYEVKAAFLLNFTKFVVWPPAAFADPAAPLTLCIWGADPFGPALDRMVEGEHAGGRPLAVRRIRAAPAPHSCQVLFIAAAEKDAASVLKTVGPNVLTVGETENFLRSGGSVAFVVENRRVRFDVNLRAATGAGLRISSRMLAVARSVQR